MENRGLQKMKSGLNGVGSNSNGLILWENDATGFRIIFKQDCWPPGAYKSKKSPKVYPNNLGYIDIVFF